MRRLRSERELSLAGLSRLVHYSKGYLSKIENGDKPVTPDVARRCDEALAADGALLALVTPVEPPARVAIPAQASGEGDQCPYLGLAAFGPDDARWFFGRERATAEVIARVTERLEDPGPVLVVGPSGVGKSSLLRAGLVPALARGVLPVPCSRDWPVVVMTPTADPLGELDRRVTPDAVLIVDQFEEVFTLCQNEDVRSRFIDIVCARELVVLGVRADFYGHLLRYPALRAAARDGQVALGPMHPDELRAAILEPARLAGLDIEPGLVELLLRDLGNISEPGMLPLLSYALLTTWQHRQSGRLTVAGYQLTGGIHAAVANTAERVHGRLDPAGQQVARRVLPRLAQVGRDSGQTRRRIGRDQLPAVLDGFVAARLLTIDEDTVAITHEALLTAWPRLQDWIETDRAGLYARQQLAEQAEAWQHHGRQTGLLAQGAPLAMVTAWAADHPDEPGELEVEFLRASNHERQRGVRRLRRLTALLGVLVLLAVVACGAAVWQRVAAGDARDVAVSEKVAAQAGVLRPTDPALAAQLGLAAYRRAKTLEARGAVLSTGMPPVSRYIVSGESVGNVVFSHDGALLAAAIDGTTVGLWDRRHHTPLTTLRMEWVCCLAFQPGTARRVLLAGAQLWDLTDVRKPTRLGALSDYDRDAAFSPDGRLVITTSTNRTPLLWDVSDPAWPRRGAELPGHRGGVVAINPAGDTLVTAHSDGLLFWRLDGTAAPTPTGGVPEVRFSPVEAVFSPDGRTLAVSYANRDTWLVDVGTRTPTKLTDDTIIAGLAFSPDSRTLATAGNDRMIRLWDVSGRYDFLTLNHPKRLQGLAFTADGSALAAGGTGGNLHIWHDPLAAAPEREDAISLVAVSRDHKLLATHNGRIVRLWDITDPRHRVPLGETTDRHAAVTGPGEGAISADNHTMAVVGYGEDVVLWDIKNPRAPTFKAYLPLHNADAVALSPDGSLMLTGDNSGNAFVWDVTGEPRRLSTLDGEFGGVHAADFSPDGRTAVTGDYGGGVRLWDLRDPKNPKEIRNHTDHAEAVVAARFTPDGRTVISTSYDWTVRVWNLDTGQVTPLTGHTDQALLVDISPDGKRFVTLGHDSTNRLWELTSTGPTAMAVLSPGLGAAVFGPDSRTLLTISKHIIRTSDIDVEAVAKRICQFAGTPITQEEWDRYFDDPRQPPCG